MNHFYLKIEYSAIFAEWNVAFSWNIDFETAERESLRSLSRHKKSWKKKIRLSGYPGEVNVWFGAVWESWGEAEPSRFHVCAASLESHALYMRVLPHHPHFSPNILPLGEYAQRERLAVPTDALASQPFWKLPRLVAELAGPGSRLITRSRQKTRLFLLKNKKKNQVLIFTVCLSQKQNKKVKCFK